jgi:hypothetical protein
MLQISYYTSALDRNSEDISVKPFSKREKVRKGKKAQKCPF